MFVFPLLIEPMSSGVPPMKYIGISSSVYMGC
jgi:hypothetical protein